MSNKYKLCINYKYNKRLILEVNSGENLLEILRNNQIPIENSCSGKGNCGKCMVKVINKSIPYSKQDIKHFSKEQIDNGFRLACTLKINEDLEIIVPYNNENMKVLISGVNGMLDVDPTVKKQIIKLDKPRLEDQRSEHNRLSDALRIDDLKIDINYLCKIEDILKEENYYISATTYKNKLLHLEGKNKIKNNYGLAIDIGTTTIAMYILNLNTGEEIDVVSQVNKQRNYGADVISRIFFTMENEDGSKILRDSIINQLNDMIGILCSNNNISSNYIYNAVIAWNTTMIHLLLKLPCKSISLAPFIPISTKELEYEGKDLGIDINGVISIMPGIASYVGSDITAGIISSNLTKNEKYSLLLDLGTNGEMALGNKDEVITCSTAAGPAFEGANIKYGIGGVKGAICKVDLSKDKVYETIENINPIGICGSGVLDGVGQLLKYNIIDETGRIYDIDELDENISNDRIVEIDNMKQFILENNNNIISITQKDIREVQLAKAAICAGIQILLKERNLNVNDIENVYIGGGFGNFMNVDSCIEIGMIPKELKDKITSIGNCAGHGAKMYLLSKNIRDDTKQIINKSTYIELSKRPDFQEYFVDCITLE